MVRTPGSGVWRTREERGGTTVIDDGAKENFRCDRMQTKYFPTCTPGVRHAATMRHVYARDIKEEDWKLSCSDKRAGDGNIRSWNSDELTIKA